MMPFGRRGRPHHWAERQNYSVALLSAAVPCGGAELLDHHAASRRLRGEFCRIVDTVVVNLREIAPMGFLGVPRIWEKMQQSIAIRIRDTTPLQRRVFGFA